MKGGFRLLGPHIDTDFGGMSGQESIRLRGLISSYLHRKFEILNLDIAEKICCCITMCRFSSRMRFISDTDSQVAYVYKENSTSRPSHFIAVEIEVTDIGADVYYWRLMQLVTFELESGFVGGATNVSEPCWTGTHNLMMVAWASGLLQGRQGQIYKAEKPSRMFANTTAEDLSIIRRLVGVVEHTVPRNDVSGSRGGKSSRSWGRSGMRSYVVDPRVRSDQLLRRRPVLTVSNACFADVLARYDTDTCKDLCSQRLYMEIGDATGSSGPHLA